MEFLGRRARGIGGPMVLLDPRRQSVPASFASWIFAPAVSRETFGIPLDRLNQHLRIGGAKSRRIRIQTAIAIGPRQSEAAAQINPPRFDHRHECGGLATRAAEALKNLKPRTAWAGPIEGSATSFCTLESSAVM